MVVTSDEFNEILDKLETSLQKVDIASGSMVKRTKAELNLLGQLEVTRDSASSVVKSGDRKLLRDIFGNDCIRIARLRAALDAVRLSDMNAADQRLPTCEKVCACVEEMVREDLGLAAKLAEAEASAQKEFMHARASILICPIPEQLALLLEAGGAGVQHHDEEESNESGLDDDSDDENQEKSPSFVFKPKERVPEEKFEQADQENTTTTQVDEEKASTEKPPPAAVETKAKEDEPKAGALDEAITAEARELFKELDKNGDGFVTKNELKQAMKQLPKIKKALKLKSFSDCTRLVDSADEDHNGNMDFEELLVYLTRLRNSQPKKVTIDEAAVRIAFEAMDRNGDGNLDLQELKLAYTGILLGTGSFVNKKRVDRWAKKNLKKFGTDSKGTLELKEFYVLVSRSGAFTSIVKQGEQQS